MRILFSALLLFFIPFAIHLCLWRANVIRRSPGKIVQIFFLSWVILLLLFYLSDPSLEKILEHSHACLAALSLFMAYLLTYTAIEADSPSGLILLKVERAGSEGLDPNLLVDLLSDEEVIIKRLRDLHAAGILSREGSRYSITKKGRLFLNLFTLPRKIFTKEEPGG